MNVASTSASSRGRRTSEVAIVVAAAGSATLVGVGVAMSGATATTLLATVIALAAVGVLRQAPLPARFALFALTVGLGALPFRVVGGAYPFWLAAGMLAIAPSVGAIRRDRRAAAALCGLALVGAATSWVLTAQSGRVTLYVIVTWLGAWTLAWWAFVPSVRSGRWSKPLWALALAGLVAAIGVITESILGIEWVATSSRILENARVEDGVQRMRGFFTSPNEAALVISAGLAAATIALTSDRQENAKVRWALAIGALTCFFALLLTGSRSSLLGALVVALVVSIPWLWRRPYRIVGLVLMLAVGWYAAQHLGTFSGRSLNVLEATDDAAEYRSQVRERLLSEIVWTSPTGFGFSEGSTLAGNRILRNSNNVDQSWIYGQLSLGVFFTLATLALLGGVLLARRGSSGWAAAAAVGWIAVTSSAENLVLLAPAWGCAVLLLAASGTRG